jgi:hypothetical protein
LNKIFALAHPRQWPTRLRAAKPLGGRSCHAAKKKKGPLE